MNLNSGEGKEILIEEKRNSGRKVKTLALGFNFFFQETLVH